jgi:hypothetical protein
MKTTLSFVLAVLAVGSFTMITVSCDEPLSTDTDRIFSKSGMSEQDELAEQQIAGFVSFPDGSHPQGEPFIRAYYSGGQYVPESADEINSNGHYGCSGVDSDWPTGWYYLETDVIYKNGDAWQGSRWSYHVYNTETTGQNITLTTEMTKQE